MRLVSFAADAGRPIRDDGFPAIDVAAFIAHVDNTPRAVSAQARNDESAIQQSSNTYRGSRLGFLSLTEAGQERAALLRDRPLQDR